MWLLGGKTHVTEDSSGVLDRAFAHVRVALDPRADERILSGRDRLCDADGVPAGEYPPPASFFSGAGAQDKAPKSAPQSRRIKRGKWCPQNKRGVRRAGPRSDAIVSGRDTKPDASGACAPWPHRPDFRPDRRPMLWRKHRTAFEPAGPRPCGLGPASGKDQEFCCGAGPSAATSAPLARSVAASNSRRRAARLGRNGSSGTVSAAGRAAVPCSKRSSLARPPLGTGPKPLRPGSPRGITPAFRPARPLPAKGPPPGLNDAPPKGWRSFRRRCFVVRGHDLLRDRRPPGLSGRLANRTALPPHVAYRRRASQKGFKRSIGIGK